MMTGLGFMGLFGGLLMILFVGAVIVVPVWLVWTLIGKNRGIPRPPSLGNPSTARQILDQRYARGEITREQYQDTLADLS